MEATAAVEVVDDEALLGIIVQNNSNEAQEVEVRFEAEFENRVEVFCNLNLSFLFYPRLAGKLRSRSK